MRGIGSGHGQFALQQPGQQGIGRGVGGPCEVVGAEEPDCVEAGAGGLQRPHDLDGRVARLGREERLRGDALERGKSGGEADARAVGARVEVQGRQLVQRALPLAPGLELDAAVAAASGPACGFEQIMEGCGPFGVGLYCAVDPRKSVRRALRCLSRIVRLPLDFDAATSAWSSSSEIWGWSRCCLRRTKASNSARARNSEWATLVVAVDSELPAAKWGESSSALTRSSGSEPVAQRRMSSAVATIGVWASGTPSENSYGPEPAGASIALSSGASVWRKTRSISAREVSMAGAMTAMRAAGCSVRRARSQRAQAVSSARSSGAATRVRLG